VGGGRECPLKDQEPELGGCQRTYRKVFLLQKKNGKKVGLFERVALSGDAPEPSGGFLQKKLRGLSAEGQFNLSDVGTRGKKGEKAEASGGDVAKEVGACAL